MVELVVHSFNELMTPVHVRPLAADKRSSPSPIPSDREGSVAFVDSNAQEPAPAANAHDVVSVQPPRVERSHEPPAHEIMEPEDAVAEHDQNRRDEVATEVKSRPTRYRPDRPSPPATTSRHRVSGMLPARALGHSTHQRPCWVSPKTKQRNRSSPRRIRNRFNPVRGWPRSGHLSVVTGESIDGDTLNVDNADVRTVFEMLARGYQMNILVAPDVEGAVTANVEGLTPEQTLKGIVKMCGLSMQQDGT